MSLDKRIHNSTTALQQTKTLLHNSSFILDSKKLTITSHIPCYKGNITLLIRKLKFMSLLLA